MSFVIKTNDDRLLLLPPVSVSQEAKIPRSLSVEFWERLKSIAEKPVKEYKKPAHYTTFIAPKISETHNKQTEETNPEKPKLSFKRNKICSRRQSSCTRHRRETQYHLTGSTYRKQRVGPSCDHCSKKKIKCDALIQVLKSDVKKDDLMLDSNGCVTDEATIKKYLTTEEIEQEYQLLYSNLRLIKFRKCSFCKKNGLDPCYKRGYTKTDILMFNLWKDTNPSTPESENRS